jgi:diguanylate cyclase (GGDEF)-like protein
MARRQSGRVLAPVAQRALRAKSVGWAVAASLVSALLLGGLWTWSSHESARASFDRTASVSLELGVLGLEQVIDGANAEAARAAESPALRAALVGTGTANAEAALRAELEKFRVFDSVLLLDSGGIPVAWTGGDPAVADLVSQLQPRRATETDLDVVMRGVQMRKDLGHPKGASTRVFDLDGTSRAVAGAAIRNADRKIVGAFHGLIRLDTLTRLLTRDEQADGTRIMLLDAEGYVVAAGEGPDGQAGESRALEFTAIEGAGWSLLYEQSIAETLRPVALPVIASLAVALVLAIVLGLLANWSSSRQVRPLWELYLGLRSARSGEPVEVAVPRAQGEAESLILAFNDTVHQLNESRATLERELTALRDQNTAFQSQRKTLAQMTITDPLTQLANRRSFEEHLQKEIKRLGRTKEGLAMLVCDIDDFKKINDEFGHAAGDEFLKQVARILKEQARETDIVARYGGEEFVVIAPSSDLEGAVVFAERVRTAVAEASFIVEETMRPRRATISIGVAVYKGSQTGLFNAADAALYQAKAAGKNCVHAAE